MQSGFVFTSESVTRGHLDKLCDQISDAIARRVLAVFDLRIGASVRDLQLRRLPARDPGGFYRKLAAYGHFGREDLDLPWERSDRVDALRNA